MKSSNKPRTAAQTAGRTRRRGKSYQHPDLAEHLIKNGLPNVVVPGSRNTTETPIYNATLRVLLGRRVRRG